MTVTVPECNESVAAVLPLGAAIASVGVSLPETVVPNADIAPRIGVSDEWIVRRTGIRTRRVAGPDERLCLCRGDLRSDGRALLESTLRLLDVRDGRLPLIFRGAQARRHDSRGSRPRAGRHDDARRGDA